ncbi:hypothetical protein GCM10009122_29220 [Fulvivirga kasyanovii]
MNGERLEIPGRIYWEEHRLMESKSLNTEQLLALSCILTRHHNGYIRQKHLQYIIDSNLDWTIPYIVQLLGEYIIEIIQVLYTRFDQINKSNLKRFIQDNSFFWDLTKSRVISYWDCYYRKKSPGQVTGFLKNDYPGFKVIDKIEGLLNI